MKHPSVCPNWLSFSGGGQRCVETSSNSTVPIVAWQYGDCGEYDEEEATISFRLCFAIPGADSKRMLSKIPPYFTYRQLLAFIERKLQELGIAPCYFEIYAGFPSSKIEPTSDEIPVTDLNIKSQVITVRLASA